MGHVLKAGAELSMVALAILSGGTLVYMDARLRKSGSSLKELLDLSLDTMAGSVKLMKDLNINPDQVASGSFETI